LPFGVAQGGEPAESRQAEVELAKGATVAQTCKKTGVADQTYCRWRQGIADGLGRMRMSCLVVGGRASRLDRRP